MHKASNNDKHKKVLRPYLRFGAMIVIAMAVMYTAMYVNTYQLDHVEWSESRLFMVLAMGASMGLVMLLFMRGMYKNTKVNIAIVAGCIAVFGLATWLVRSQMTVEDESYMKAMIPHHSIAILTSENSQIQDQRVCQLAVEIIEAQKREIEEMKWLIDDINKNGVAITATETNSRPAPEFEVSALRHCDVE